MSDCRKCAKFEECAVDEDCGLFVDKPMTNADRIRRMSDEELAEEIVKCRNADIFRRDVLGRWMYATDEWLDWLKSPVEVDNGT